MLTDNRGAYLKRGSIGAVRAANTDIGTRPRLSKRDGTHRGAILCHGAGGTATSWFDPAKPGSGALRALITARHFCYAGDFGGDNWGNANALADVAAASALLEAGGASAGPKLVAGGSMGGLVATRYAAQHPEDVAGLALWIPAIDAAAVRALFPASFNTAWGLAAQDPLPNVVPDANPVNLPGQIACPVFLAYASDDPLVSPATAVTFAAALDDVTLISVGALGHSEAALTAAAAPFETWLRATFPTDYEL